MKKIFFMLAMCLSVFTFVSCGDDDKAPAFSYQWGIYETYPNTVISSSSPCPLYVWLKDEVAALNKTYEGKQRTSNEESVLSRMESATQALDELTGKFEEWKKTKDAGDSNIETGFLFRIYKDGEVLKESREYRFEQKYKYDSRVKASGSITIPKAVSDALQFAESTSGTLSLSAKDMGLFDGANLNISLADEPIVLVNAETLEFANDSFLGDFALEPVEMEGVFHKLSMNYKFNKSTVQTWKGNWYLLVPVNMGDMVIESQIPVVVE